MNRAAGMPSFSRPAFVLEAQKEFDSLAESDAEVRFIDCFLVDINGVLRGKRLPIADAPRLFECGMQIPSSAYLMDPRGEMTSPFGRGFADGDPDGTAWPIPGTFSLVWGEGPPRLQVLTTMRNEEGTVEPAEPRAALERVLERFIELGLVPVTALELEFYLIDRGRAHDGAPLLPRDPKSGLRDNANAVHEINDLVRYGSFFAALEDAADLQGVPVNAVSSEYAPGQFEVNLRHRADALRAADDAIFLKQIIKAAAQASGLDVTFMAKPYAERTGSGLHVHTSLLDASGRNIFDDGSVEGSRALRYAIGGLAALMPEAMALFAPSVNSYRRFQPDMFAPVNRRWAVNNRSVGLRIPVGPGEARRVEHRAAGADANPYLALAAVLAGIHYGIANAIDPDPAAIGNASRAPDPDLPLTLEDALAKLGAARTLGSYLGEETVALYRESKRLELARFRKIVSQAEYEWYL